MTRSLLVALVVLAAVLIVGTILMGVAFERVQFMVARVVTGFGDYPLSSVSPQDPG